MSTIEHPEASRSPDRRSIEGLLNVALGKAASQSSSWQGSREGEAANAVSGRIAGDYAFHTDMEDRPWWQVDLGGSYPIEVIIVHNRLSACRERARRLRIELADHPDRWTLIHAGFADFGAGRDGGPFESWIGGALQGRFVRISLDEPNYLHLSQVEVLVRKERSGLDAYRQRFNLVNFHDGVTDFGRPYAVETAPGADTDTIVGLKITHAGRFGNLLQQYIHMIQLARLTGLSYLQLGHHPLFDFKQVFTVDGITVLPPDAALPPAGAFITGSFFNSDPFWPVLGPFLRFRPEDEIACSLIARDYVRPHLLTGIPLPGEQQFRDELTIHIRSGDVFVGDQTGSRAYRQPPLSFYTMVIERMRRRGVIDRVRLVFEDRANPCIDRLEAWLDGHGIAYRVQCGSLHEDMSALIDAPHLVFGHGTFGYAACRLSKRIETLHFFTPELGGRYAHIPSIETVYAVSDAKGDYIEAGAMGVSSGQWCNSAEQREMMLTYPEDFLTIETVREEGQAVVSPPRNL